MRSSRAERIPRPRAPLPSACWSDFETASSCDIHSKTVDDKLSQELNREMSAATGYFSGSFDGGSLLQKRVPIVSSSPIC